MVVHCLEDAHRGQSILGIAVAGPRPNLVLRHSDIALSLAVTPPQNVPSCLSPPEAIQFAMAHARGRPEEHVEGVRCYAVSSRSTPMAILYRAVTMSRPIAQMPMVMNSSGAVGQ